MEKKNIIKASQTFCLLAFAAMGLACSSYQEAGKHVDNARDAYNYTKSQFSDVETETSEGIVNIGDLADMKESINPEKQPETQNL